MPRLLLSLILAGLAAFAQANQTLLTGSQTQAALILAGGDTLPVRLALTREDQKKGLSGVAKEDFGDEEGMFFSFKETQPRSIWMPNTFFNLDVIFLDEDLEVIRIVRNLEHYPHTIITPSVPTTPRVSCRHFLEIPSDSPLARKIKIGDTLRWAPPMTETKLKEWVLKANP